MKTTRKSSDTHARITHKRVLQATPERVPGAKLQHLDLVVLPNGRKACWDAERAQFVRPRTQVFDPTYTWDLDNDEFVVIGRCEPVGETRAEFIARVSQPKPKARKRTRKAAPAPKTPTKSALSRLTKAELIALLAD